MPQKEPILSRKFSMFLFQQSIAGLHSTKQKLIVSSILMWCLLTQLINKEWLCNNNLIKIVQKADVVFLGNASGWFCLEWGKQVWLQLKPHFKQTFYSTVCNHNYGILQKKLSKPQFMQNKGQGRYLNNLLRHTHFRFSNCLSKQLMSVGQTIILPTD